MLKGVDKSIDGIFYFIYSITGRAERSVNDQADAKGAATGSTETARKPIHQNI